MKAWDIDDELDFAICDFLTISRDYLFRRGILEPFSLRTSDNDVRMFRIGRESHLQVAHGDLYLALAWGAGFPRQNPLS